MINRLSDSEILEAFHLAADRVIGDYIQSDEWDETVAEMPREYVVSKLRDYGGTAGEIIDDWIRSTANWSEICDEIGVPVAWTP